MNLTKKRDAALLREPPPLSSSYDRVWLKRRTQLPSFQLKQNPARFCFRFPVAILPAAPTNNTQRSSQSVTLSQNHGKSSSDGEYDNNIETISGRSRRYRTEKACDSLSFAKYSIAIHVSHIIESTVMEKGPLCVSEAITYV
jgi:hypothetical protein